MASKGRRSASQTVRRAKGSGRADTDVPVAGDVRARRTPPRAALGNDPFSRGAAPRASLKVAPGPNPAPPQSSGPATARPSGPATARLDRLEQQVETALGTVQERIDAIAARSGAAQAGEELREAVLRLLPRLKDALAGAANLVFLAEPAERLDRHGMDTRFAQRAQPLLDLLYSGWWRTGVRGAEQVPSVGPVIVVANHAGVVPWDALVLRQALRRDHPARRDLRPLLDDRECALPVFGAAAVRLGAVRASAESAERILRDGGAVGVFPEGSAGARKPWRERYRIGHFGRGGFVKVALRTGATLVPCAILGSEEASPGISRAGWLADLVGVPLLAASPALRFLPAALLPLPSRWSLRFGAAVPLTGLGPAHADDPAAVNEVAERVRATLQAMIDEDLAARGSVYL